MLRLMADGLDTAEMAEEMRYSVRTVKSVVLPRHGPAQASQPAGCGRVRGARRADLRLRRMRLVRLLVVLGVALLFGQGVALMPASGGPASPAPAGPLLGRG